jgi:uncharacterized membrane protein YfcA
MEDALDVNLVVALMSATLVGAFVQSATGFGFALVAAPIFLIAMDSVKAIIVLVALHVVQSAMLVPRLWRHAPSQLLLPMMAGSLAGMPIGLAILSHLDLQTLKLAVGLVLLLSTALLAAREVGWLSAFGARSAISEARITTAGSVGFLSGLLTALLVMPGPPLIVYSASLDIEKIKSRALSLTLFGFCYVATTVFHAVTGNLTQDAWQWLAILVPAVIVGTYLGDRANAWLSEYWFRMAVLVIAGLSGILVLAASR